MKPTFELSEDVAKLVDYLATRPRATYAELSQAVGRDIDGRDRYVLSSARRVLEKRGVIFAVERGIGIVRADDVQVAELSTSEPIHKIRRATGRARKRQDHVNIQKLTVAQRLRFDVGRSVIEAVRSTTSRALRKRLEKEINKQDGGVVNISSVLALPRHREKNAK